RGGGPFQGSAIPRVAGQIEPALARANADIELGALTKNAADNDDGPGLRDQQQRPPTGIGNVLKAARHAHQTQRIERREREIEADKPAPEAGVAEAFVEGEPESLRKPVVDTRQRAEHD